MSGIDTVERPAIVGPPTTEWARCRPRRVDAFVDFAGPGGVAVQHGLNGIRGLAVISVVLYHLGYVNVVGGAQLAMSLFFTQSGLLITTLILQEYGTTGRFRPVPFWATRARRLLPPAWLTLAAVGLIRCFAKAFDASLRIDLIVTFFNVTNWYFAFTNAVEDTFFRGRGSELNHTWSLSIEEQFYVVLALAALVVLTTSRRPVVVLRWIALSGAVVSFALPYVYSMDHNRTFFGTDTRAGELLVGVAMATFLISRDLRVLLLRHSWVIATLGTVALVITLGLWHGLSWKARLPLHGLLPFGTALWVFVIVGAMVPDGPVVWLMHVRVLQWLGRLSYGIYLYHFPLLALQRYYVPGFSLAISVGVVAVTLVVAELSYRFVEMPIRRRRFAGRRLSIAASTVLAVIVLTTALS